MIPTEGRADNQWFSVTLTGCCGDNCGTATCSLDAEVFFTRNSVTCSPNCYATAILVQGDSGCTIDENSFRFVRESSDCVDDVTTPFSFPFPLNTPFLVTTSEMSDILDVATRIEVETDDPLVSLRSILKKIIESIFGIPTVSTWGLAAMSVVLLSVGTIAIRRRARAA